MNKKVLKYFSCLALGVAFVVPNSVCHALSDNYDINFASSNTSNVTTLNNTVINNTTIVCPNGDVIQNSSPKNKHISKKHHVHNSHEFAAKVSSLHDGDTVILEDDIELDRCVEITKSITLDLNNYHINMSNGAFIKIGAKIFNHTDYYTVDHPGYYTTERIVSYVSNPDVAVLDAWGNVMYYQHVPDTEVVTYEDRWHPGWTETVSEDIYDYLDCVDVLIENGSIKGARGKNGADGKENTFSECSGCRGEDGHSAIEIVSGTLRVKYASIIGGDGGNGGDGRYQAIMHIPFFTGNGGKGGNGGDAGSAVALLRSSANVIKESGSVLRCGTPGYGGKGGPANSNHWVGHGKDGRDGGSGISTYEIKRI